MKRVWLVIVAISIAVLLQASETQDPFQNIKYFKLDNGMQVYLLADPKAEKTRFRLSIGVGYDNETERNYGISHLVEHLVFRDQRVPHHDYLDYLREEGGSKVNGFTKRYETGYVATVPAEKSYWVAKIFFQMLFDKNVTKEDLEIERKALQTEIGEPRWYSSFLFALKDFFEAITPPQEDFYVEQFGLPKEKELPAYYHAQENNKRFTLDEVMARYKAYYYPANMKLMVAGNFEREKMLQQIVDTFGQVSKKGGLKVAKPYYKPKSNGKPYLRFYEGAPENYASIGAKYIIDDYKKYLILKIYTNSLAQRLQQLLRNKYGKTYSVNESGFAYKRAGAALVEFDGLADVFSENIAEAEKMIDADRRAIDKSTITKAIKQYEKQYYSAIEHDSDTLMEMIETAEYLRQEHNITDQTSYSIFKSITVDEFRDVVAKTFRPQNRYKYVEREYYFFPMETPLVSLSFLLLFVLVYIFWGRWQLRRMGIFYTQRDIIFQRRLSSRFTSFLLFVLTMLVASISFAWIEYLLPKWITGDPHWLKRVDVPYSYIITLIDNLGYLLWFFLLYFFIWRYYARLHLLGEKLILIGNRVDAIEKEQIEKIDVVPQRARQKGMRTFGFAWRFWKPLTALQCKEGKVCYLRSSNAVHLKEDLESWLQVNR